MRDICCWLIKVMRGVIFIHYPIILLIHPRPLFCHLCPPTVTPAPFSLHPLGQAGNQGPMQCIAGVRASGGKILSVALGPRFHGGDKGGESVMKTEYKACTFHSIKEV